MMVKKMTRRGIKVIRITNTDVAKDLEKVLKEVALKVVKKGQIIIL